jgi:hypothetical protein
MAGRLFDARRDQRLIWLAALWLGADHKLCASNTCGLGIVKPAGSAPIAAIGS